LQSLIDIKISYFYDVYFVFNDLIN